MKKSDVLFKVFSEGRVPGEVSVPIHIETTISHVFLFAHRVYKIYKSDADFFNRHFRDISHLNVRKTFTMQDFDWNARLTKSVYLQCWPVSTAGGTLSTAHSIDEADELVIVTRRIPAENLLFHILESETAPNVNFGKLGEQFAEKEKLLLPLDPPVHLTAYDDTESRIFDLENWLPRVQDRGPDETFWSDGMNYLRDHICIVRNAEYDLLPALDIHALNAFVEDDALLLFDSFAPKSDWQYGASPLNIYRFAVDVYVHKGKNAYREVLHGYSLQTSRKQIHESSEVFWLIYAGLIMATYMRQLGKSDRRMKNAALKYDEFLKILLYHSIPTKNAPLS